MPDESTVHVIDDDQAVRESVAFLLTAAGFEVRAHDSAEAFLDGLEQIKSGCIVTDVRMPQMSGLELLQRVRQTRPDLPVIVITGPGDVALAVEAMKAGAADFLEKPFDDEALVSAVEAALRRQASGDGRDAERRELAQRIEALSGRERQVLEGLVAGRPNKIIAFDLGISPRTVEIYRANLMTKMHAASLSELVRMALIAGLLPNQTLPLKDGDEVGF
jgi:two-component system, LuxR family, response regulator FixJ